MSGTSKSRPRAPRIWWEVSLFAAALLLPSTLYPFANAANGAVTPFGMSAVVGGLAVLMLLISLIWDIGPTFIEKAEAEYQNLYARDAYSVPAAFDVIPTFVPGFSRLRATRTDTNQPIGAWALRLKHGRQVI